MLSFFLPSLQKSMKFLEMFPDIWNNGRSLHPGVREVIRHRLKY